MIELERSTDGFIKSFKQSVAQKAIFDSVGQKERNQGYWKIPEDSDHKLDKDGLIVLKKKK